jgi:hypothetical protein
MRTKKPVEKKPTSQKTINRRKKPIQRKKVTRSKGPSGGSSAQIHQGVGIAIAEAEVSTDDVPIISHEG